MTFPVIVLVTTAILAVVAALATYFKSAALAERKGALEQELTATRADLERRQTEISSLLTAKASLEATLASEREATQEKLLLITSARTELENSFKALANSALESSNANFLELAKATLEKYQSEAKGELEAREKAVEMLVKPVAESLKQVDEQVRELEKTRAQAYGTLTSQVASLLDTQKALQTETGNLVKALREPQARGRWGELQLRRVLELAGMLEHCDFLEQETITGDERRSRPDVVVQLPGEKQIIVDAKVPLTSYLAALEAADEATRDARLADHARQMRHHIDGLGARSYWEQLPCTPEFVVLFLPGEVFFRAAMDCDSELIDYGVSRKVIVASPTTLIALLKAVAYGWNQKNLADSARHISQAGRDLYKRLGSMAGHVHEMGKKLGGAVTAYNEMLGSMERRVFPAARKFPELDRSLAAAALPELEQLDKAPFELQSPDWQEDEEQSTLDLSESKADSAKM
ncbi:MAG: DNA recombination protein RmuC [Candidatus Korobacteraceae bacterium]|jgi:DNA recombination protein RmuC